MAASIINQETENDQPIKQTWTLDSGRSLFTTYAVARNLTKE